MDAYSKRIFNYGITGFGLVNFLGVGIDELMNEDEMEIF